MKTLLIPVNFSESPEQLIHAAINHFQEMPLEIALVHAYSLPHKPTELVRKALTHCLSQESLDKMKDLKQAILRRYTMFPSIQVRTYSEFGSVQQVVEDHARLICPDFVVLAEPARTGFWAKLNPPLATRLVNRVEVPVLTLPLRSLRRAEERFIPSNASIQMP